MKVSVIPMSKNHHAPDEVYALPAILLPWLKMSREEFEELLKRYQPKVKP